MSDRIGKRVVVWLPQDLLDHIKMDKEAWRTMSEYVRDILIREVPKPPEPKPAKPAKVKPESAPKPQILSKTDFWAVAHGIEPDQRYWDTSRAGHDSDEEFMAAMQAVPAFQNALEQYRRDNKKPAEAG